MTTPTRHYNPLHFANPATTKEEAARVRTEINAMLKDNELDYLKLKISTVKKFNGVICNVLKFVKQTGPHFHGAKYKDVYINLVEGKMFIYGTQNYGPREEWALMANAKVSIENMQKLAARIHKI